MTQNNKKALVYFWTFILLIITVSVNSQEVAIFDIARKGTLKELKTALNINPNCLSLKNDAGYSPLILASYAGNNEVAKYIATNVLDINENIGYGTALMAATIKKNNELVDFLLKNKADPNISDSNGTTALHYSVMFQADEITALLMKHYANPNLKDGHGNTPLDYAKLNKNESIINLLKQ